MKNRQRTEGNKGLRRTAVLLAFALLISSSVSEVSAKYADVATGRTHLSITPVTAASLTFSANGGSGSALEPMTVHFGQEKILPVIAFKKDGYVASGWNTAANGTGTHYDGGSAFLNEVDAEWSLPLYAEWGPIPYFIPVKRAACRLRRSRRS